MRDSNSIEPAILQELRSEIDDLERIISCYRDEECIFRLILEESLGLGDREGVKEMGSPDADLEFLGGE